MELEKELKQERFTNEYQKFLLNIMYTGNWITARVSRSLKDYGISPQQFNILRILRGQKGQPVPVGIIQDRMLDRSSNVTRLLDKLVAKKLVDRQECGEDRRRMNNVITEQGLALLQQIEDSDAVSLKEQFDLITDEEAKMVNAVLDKFRG